MDNLVIFFWLITSWQFAKIFVCIKIILFKGCKWIAPVVFIQWFRNIFLFTFFRLLYIMMCLPLLYPWSKTTTALLVNYSEWMASYLFFIYGICICKLFLLACSTICKLFIFSFINILYFHVFWVIWLFSFPKPNLVQGQIKVFWLQIYNNTMILVT